jgi:integrase
MAIQRRGNRFRVLYDGADGRKHSGGTYDTEREAQLAYKAAVGKVAAARIMAPVELYMPERGGKVTVSGYAPGWLAVRQVAERTRETYESVLRVHVFPRWGSTPLDKITPADVRGWVAEMVAGGTGYYRLAVIRTAMSAMLTTAAEDGLIPVNPVRGVKLPHKPAARRTPPDADTYQALVQALPEPYDLLARIEWQTGMRTGEVLALEPGDVDGRTIHVTKTMTELKSPQRFVVKLYPKNEEDRDILIGADFADELRAGLPIRTPDGKVPSRATLQRKWVAACKAAGIPYSWRHDLRHAHASMLANDPNVPLFVTMDRLGHRSTATTRGYVHRDLGAQDAAVAAIERLTNGSAA